MHVILFALLIVPALIIGGLLVMIAIGGIVGCTECVLDRIGMQRFAPAVVADHHTSVSG